MKRRQFLGTAAAVGATLAAPSIARAFEVEPQFLPQQVAVRPEIAPGNLLVVPQQHFLYFVTEPGIAMRYGVGVGAAGWEFRGVAHIGAKKEWPTWRPTDEMIEREPNNYAKFAGSDYVQPGGPGNPLGARALYLFKNGRDTYFRIHGTTSPQSIGRSVSHGCIRMINEHVMDLYERVPVGTQVTVF